MKRFIFIFLISICSFTFCFADDNDVINIKEVYYQLKQLQPTLKQKMKSLDNYSSGGGEAIYYIDGNSNILIVEAIFYGEIGKTREEYYYKNNVLVFLLRIEEIYNSHIRTLTMSNEELKEEGMERLDYKKSKFEENRFYFKNNKLILWMMKKNKKNVAVNQTKWNKEENEILKFSKELYDIGVK